MKSVQFLHQMSAHPGTLTHIHASPSMGRLTDLRPRRTCGNLAFGPTNKILSTRIRKSEQNDFTSFVPCCTYMNQSCFNRYRSEEHTSELQSLRHLVCRLLLEKK